MRLAVIEAIMKSNDMDSSRYVVIVSANFSNSVAGGVVDPARMAKFVK